MFFKFNRFTQGSFGPQYRNKSPVLTKAANNSFFGQNFNLNRFNTTQDDLTSDSVLEQWLPSTPILLHKLFRIIHRFDSVAGPAVDLISIMPFSDVTLVGVNDKAILDVYEQSIQELHLSTLLPDIASEFMVIGRVIGSLLFDSNRGIWTDIIIQDPDFCEITNIPLRGHDPKIDLKVSGEFKEFLRSKDPRDLEAKKEIPKDFVNQLEKYDTLPLDPASTLYLPRQTTPYDFMGSSIYNRILPFFALEKTLINGTLVGAKRRQRSILHVTVGETDLWEPDEEDISTIAGMFMQADEDPQGAIVATRMGVETNEVRSGSDFWKISDEWDFLSNAKMRALGINESFLCITGDSLIPTEKGILRIDEIADSSTKDEPVDIDIVVASKNCNAKASKWYYRGISDVIETKSKSGRVIKSTENHEFLVLNNNDLIWKKTKDLKIDDLLCLSLNKCTSNKDLKLNFPNIVINKHATNLKIPKAPEYMTPDLAFIIGLLVSEGCCDKDRVRFSNSDINLLDKYKFLIKKIFNLESEVRLTHEAGKEIVICGNKTITTKDGYEITVWSNVLSQWMNYLGINISNQNDNSNNKSKHMCWNKTVPWCILQADEESQLSYLAAYIEGDGSIQKEGKSINFYSRCLENLRQIQIILASHGILSSLLEKYYRLTLSVPYSCELYSKLEKYLVSKHVENFVYSKNSYRKLGIPTKYLVEFLKDRKTQSTNLGAWFKNDDDGIIFIPSWGIIDKSRWNYLLYKSYKEGMYNDFLDALKKISEIEYNKIIKLFSYNYYFDPIVEQSNIGNHKLYDISMGEGNEPAFVANSLVIHNSGDATYNCTIGSSLIPTEKGILRIDEITEGNEGDIKNIDLTVGSKYGEGKAIKWLNNGVADVLKLETEYGNSIECTPKHAFLVLKDNELVWVKAGDIELKDTVCINTRPLVRKDKLLLDLEDEKSLGKKPRKDIIKPKYMTPDLAYIIGCLISEGTIFGADVKFYNGDDKYIEKYRNCIKEVFGLETSIGINTPKGTKKVIKGEITYASRNCYQILACHQTLSNWFKKLGLKECCASEKTIPWSILQADEQSQLAFLAAYIEGDGNIQKGGVLRYYSASDDLLTKLQIMLNSHGLFSTRAKTANRIDAIVLGNLDSFTLWNKIKQYVVSKEYHKTYDDSIIRKGYGFSASYIRGFIDGRKIKSNRCGVVFRTDDDKELIVKNWAKNGIFRNTMFLYDNYNKGSYNEFLNILEKISKTEYDKLIILLNSKYRFAQISSKTYVGQKPVYDLSMSKENDPVYVSDCFITHNTMETALTVFIETLRTFRDNLVNKIFYEKLFPTLAEIHGFKKRTQAELSHRIRIEGSKNTNIDSNLIMPQINFHKQLRPEADSAYLDILTTMEEKGIPIPLRTWTAAAGLSLEKLMDMKEEDIKNRSNVKGWLKAIKSEEGEGEGEGENSAWGSTQVEITSSIKNALDTLPVWIQNKFLGIRKETFINIIKSSNPSRQLKTRFKNDVKKLATGNYILHRLGVSYLPLDISAVKNIAEHLNKCSSIFSNRKIKGEFMALNKIIRKSSDKVKKTPAKQLPAINTDKNLYIGM